MQRLGKRRLLSRSKDKLGVRIKGNGKRCCRRGGKR
jgi:hypothetical protein